MGDFLSVHGGLKKIHSTSSILSGAPTFYSAPSTPSNPSDSKTSSGMETDLLHRTRTDSGFTDTVMVAQTTTKEMQSENQEHSSPSVISNAHPVEEGPVQSSSERKEDPSSSKHRPSRIANHRSSTAPLPESTKARKSSSRQSSRSRSGSYTSQDAMGRGPPYLHARRPRPAMLARSSSAISGRQLVEDPYLIHQRAREIFQCVGVTSASLPPSPGDHREPLLLSRDTRSSTSHTQPLHARSLSSSFETLSPKTAERSSFSHTPCTIIDWKTPASRRREYEKIDRSTRGLRGLWRKVTPSWLRGGKQISFYEGKDDDAGSVRRYRLDLPEEKDEKGDGHVTEREGRPRLFTVKTSWSCFSGKSVKDEKDS
ncbi:hypothetical protein MMC30_005997 [Trapelia coarctata]|nr:hypothetical protein [Trapelia coarctata]